MNNKIQKKIYKGMEPEKKNAPAKCLYPLTARLLFRQALNLPDPARCMFGYHYEAELLRECSILIPFPLYRGDRAGCLTVCQQWYRNQACFPCRAIGNVLVNYAMEAASND